MFLDEASDGANYLSGLKRSGSAQPAEAAVSTERPQSAEVLTGAAAPSSKADIPSADNRRSPRYKCQGSARLQEVGSGTSTWVKFADISMHGCYVEATSPLPVGAVLGLHLEVNGIRVTAAAEVCVSYANLGMGISFTKISDEDRKRLRELVRSISPPSVILSSRAARHFPAIAPAEALPVVANPGAALQAIVNFFQDRHTLGREEFLVILRKSQ